MVVTKGAVTPSHSSSATPKSAARVRQSRGRGSQLGHVLRLDGDDASGLPLPLYRGQRAGYKSAAVRGPRLIYAEEIGKMMYTHGDVRKTDPEAVALMEIVTREEVINTMKATGDVTRNRGSITMNIADVAFVIRHDKAKLRRLLEFLGWKEVRQKMASDDSSKDTNEMDGEAMETDQLLEDGAGNNGPMSSLKMPWDFVAELSRLAGGHHDIDQFTITPPEKTVDNQRQENADRLTKTMTKVDYIDYTECRQASFTYKKQKKFREWLDNMNFFEFNPNTDVTEVFGYLAWEVVAHITECALKIKQLARDQAAAAAAPSQAGNTDKEDTGEDNSAGLSTSDIYEALRRIRSARHMPRKTGVWQRTRDRRGFL